MWTQTGTGTVQPLAGARTPAAVPARGAGRGPRRDGAEIRGDPGLRSRRGAGETTAVTPSRWQVVRDLLGGSFLLAVWLALWTVTWAAVAGPLSPAAHPRAPGAETARAEAAAGASGTP